MACEWLWDNGIKFLIVAAVLAAGVAVLPIAARADAAPVAIAIQNGYAFDAAGAGWSDAIVSQGNILGVSIRLTFNNSASGTYAYEVRCPAAGMPSEAVTPNWSASGVYGPNPIIIFPATCGYTEPGAYILEVAVGVPDLQGAVVRKDFPIAINYPNGAVSPSGSSSFTINGSAAASFAVGDSWTLQLSSALVNKPFSVCAIHPDGEKDCTPSAQFGGTGATDQEGNWSLAGSFGEASIGYWKEWVCFGAVSACNAQNTTAQVSNQIAFAVDAGVSGSAPTPAPTSTPPIPSGSGTTLIGPYFWGGSLINIPSSGIIAKGQALAEATGAQVLRISMSPSSDRDYSGGACIPNFTLAGLAARPDFNAILSDPQFSTVIITAYDGASWSDCATKSYRDPSFYTAANVQKIEQEYADFANYLKQFNKKFIISNWEGDNDAYCGNAYGVSQGTATCPDAAASLAGMAAWFQARYLGIHAAGASNVFAAVEFNSVHMLHDHGLPSVLYDVIPQVAADYYSYSSYESINQSPDQLGTDIDTIRSVIGAKPLIVGEFGYRVGDFGDAAVTASRLQQTAAVIAQKNLPYGIVWNLLDLPAGMGMYDASGQITPSGNTLQAIDSPPTDNPPMLLAANPAAVLPKVTVHFPATITVTASSLYVRSAPNSSAPLSGSEVLHAGDVFTAVKEVKGQSVGGNNLWWVSAAGNYVWSGGTQAGAAR